MSERGKSENEGKRVRRINVVIGKVERRERKRVGEWKRGTEREKNRENENEGNGKKNGARLKAQAYTYLPFYIQNKQVHMDIPE